MTEHPTKLQLDEYCRRVLAPAAFLPVHQHVTSCPRCSAQCNSPEQLSVDLDHLQEALIGAPDVAPYHLSAAEVKAYAQGTLDDIDFEIADSHLGICATCQSEVQRQAVQPVHVHAPVSTRRRWFSLRFGNAWQPVHLAVAVLVGAILILLTVWLLQTGPVEHRTDGPANTTTPQSSSTAEVQTTNTPDVSANGASQPAPEFALLLTDGSRKVTLDTRGTLAGLEQLPANIQEKLAAALKTGKLTPPADLAQLESQRSTLLGESAGGLPFRLIGPLGQIVRSQQPSFHWHPLEGAQSYKVIVTDSELNEVATSEPLNTTAWRITKPLRHGGIYSWQVTALKDGVEVTSPVLPAPQAKFKVIDAASARMLQHAERAYPDSRLTFGVLYAEAGLLEQAEQELTALVRSNPQARIAQQLLQNVRAMRAARNSS